MLTYTQHTIGHSKDVIYVVSDVDASRANKVWNGSITKGWIKGQPGAYWNDYVGDMQFGNVPTYATVEEAFEAFKAH